MDQNLSELPASFTPVPPEEWLGYLLSRLGGRVRESTDFALESINMTARTLGVLALIEQQPGLKQVLVSERMGFDRTSTSQLVDDLTRTGLVERAIDTRDRRSNALRLTNKGRQRLAEAINLGTKAERDFVSALVDDEVSELKRILAKLLKASMDL